MIFLFLLMPIAVLTYFTFGFATFLLHSCVLFLFFWSTIWSSACLIAHASLLHSELSVVQKYSHLQENSFQIHTMMLTTDSKDRAEFLGSKPGPHLAHFERWVGESRDSE